MLAEQAFASTSNLNMGALGNLPASAHCNGCLRGRMVNQAVVAALQIAVEVILGMGAAWSEPATMGQVRKAFDDYASSLLSVVPLAIPGSSKFGSSQSPLFPISLPL